MKHPFRTALILVLASCATPPAPPPRAKPAVVHHAVPDWFQQQLARARQARREHVPKEDAVGAQQAYDDVMHAACTRAAAAGPGRYPARCDAVLKPPAGPVQPDPFACTPGSAQDATAECSD